MTAIPNKAKEELDQYFTEGSHKVTIGGSTLEDSGDKEYIDVSIKGENGESTSVRMYVTEDAMKYTFDTIRKIFVHNTPDTAKKESVKAIVNACKTTEELAILFSQMDGKECWYSKKKTGGQYVNSQGETKDSYSNKLWGHVPPAMTTSSKPTSVAQRASHPIGGGEVTKDNLDEFPFN